jgi:small subunit ribosomal protein S20
LANHKSAIKRISQSERRRKRNQHVRSKMRSTVKRYRDALATGNSATAGEAFKVVEREIRRAASRGVIPKKRADRSVGRLAKQLNALS